MFSRPIVDKWSFLFLVVRVSEALILVSRNTKIPAHHSAYFQTLKSSWKLTWKRSQLLPQVTNLIAIKSLRQSNSKGQNFPVLHWIDRKTTNFLVFTQTKPEALMCFVLGRTGTPQEHQWQYKIGTLQSWHSSVATLSSQPLAPCVPVLVPWVQNQGMAWCGAPQTLQENSWQMCFGMPQKSWAPLEVWLLSKDTVKSYASL